METDPVVPMRFRIKIEQSRAINAAKQAVFSFKNGQMRKVNAAARKGKKMITAMEMKLSSTIKRF